MKILYYYFLLFCLFTACRSEVKSTFTFPQKKNLTVTSLVFPEDSKAHFKYPYRIALDNNYLYVFDLHALNDAVRVFTFPELKAVSGVGKHGKGPLELSLFTPFALKNGYLHLLDGASGKILTYSTADFSVPSSVVYLKEPSTINLDFSALTDSTFLFVDLKGKNRLKIIDAQGNVTDHLYPAFQIDTNNQFQEYYWRSFIDYHPKLQIAALATQHSNVIEIYHLKTKDKHIIAPDGIEVKMAYNEKNPSIAGYQDIKITDKYIYALYNGSSFEERMQESQKGHRLPDGGNRIHVFDLKGKPVAEYTLDRHLSGIYVDEESETIYGTDVNSADFFCCFKK